MISNFIWNLSSQTFVFILDFLEVILLQQYAAIIIIGIVRWKWIVFQIEGSINILITVL